ncbi:MAG TPA: hypothetical protein VL970_09285 [Candidatus Acidoferrales bacterium]|nr:hypothetical protein [Candidatus Acidoferrales bacterium]
MKMNILKLAAAVTGLSLMAGCIVLSVYPFYTKRDLLFDPALAGRWADARQSNAFWQFADLAEKSYLVTTTDEHDTNCFEAHLFQLKQYQFLDLLTTNRGEFEMPMHLISKVARADTNLSLQFMDFGWLAGLLETNPAVLRHIVVPTEPGNTNNNMVYLTADTKDLQKFLLKHAEDTNAFNLSSAVELRRVSP